MTYSMKARLLLAGAAFASMSLPAFALDGNDLVAKINKALAVQGGSGFSAETITVAGKDVTAVNAKVASADGKQSLPLGTVKFQGVEEANGGYTVETVAFGNIDMTQDNMNLTAVDMSISGLTVPADPTGSGLDAIMLYEEGHVGKVTGTVGGKQAFSIEESAFSSDVALDKTSIDFDLEISGIKADLSLVDEPEAKDTIQQLGLTSIDGKITMQGSWTLKDGTIEVDEYAFDFANVGKLNITMSIAGYTLDFIKSLIDTVKTMEANSTNQDAQQAAGIAMLGLMQQLTFNGAEIRFEDAGITKKGLDYAAKKQNTTATQLSQMLKGMTPLMLAQFNVPDLQNMVTTAVNAYLDKPGSFTISAEPDEAVPFPMIMGAAMGAPNTLPKVLGISVTAND